MSYKNVPTTIGIVLSSSKATLHEMQTVYGLEDVFDMIEVIGVDNFNLNLARKQNV